MDDQQATSTTPARESLRRNSLNLPRLAFIGLAYFSLAPVFLFAVSLWQGGREQHRVALAGLGGDRHLLGRVVEQAPAAHLDLALG